MRLWVRRTPLPSLTTAAVRRQHRGNSWTANSRPASRFLGMDASSERLPATGTFYVDVLLSLTSRGFAATTYSSGSPTFARIPLLFGLDQARRAAEQGISWPRPTSEWHTRPKAHPSTNRLQLTPR